MAESADVLSIEAIRDFRAALCRFAEEVKIALGDTEFELRRALEWLSNEQRLHWQAEIRNRERALTVAKAALQRKEMSKFNDRRPDTTAEEKEVRRAKERLEEAHEKLKKTKAWLPQLQHAAEEYRARSNPLAGMMEGDLKRSVALLDRMLDALDQYANLSAPTGGSASGGPGQAVSREQAAEPAAVATGPDQGPSEPEPESDAEPEGAHDERDGRIG